MLRLLIKIRPVFVKNPMKLTPLGVKKTITAVNYKDALMDSIYETSIPASQERVFDFVMMTIEAAGIPA